MISKITTSDEEPGALYIVGVSNDSSYTGDYVRLSPHAFWIQQTCREHGEPCNMDEVTEPPTPQPTEAPTNSALPCAERAAGVRPCYGPGGSPQCAYFDNRRAHRCVNRRKVNRKWVSTNGCLRVQKEYTECRGEGNGNCARIAGNACRALGNQCRWTRSQRRYNQGPTTWNKCRDD